VRRSSWRTATASCGIHSPIAPPQAFRGRIIVACTSQKQLKDPTNGTLGGHLGLSNSTAIRHAARQGFYGVIDAMLDKPSTTIALGETRPHTNPSSRDVSQCSAGIHLPATPRKTAAGGSLRSSGPGWTSQNPFPWQRRSTPQPSLTVVGPGGWWNCERSMGGVACTVATPVRHPRV